MRSNEATAPRPDRRDEATPSSVHAALTAYDDELRAALAAVRAAASATERLRLLRRRLVPAVAVHDAVLTEVVCPLLEQLPGGAEPAARLREGCAKRAALLERFEGLTRHVAATNVYPIAGTEVEEVLAGLDQSLEADVAEQTRTAADVLVAASVDPDRLAEAMAVEARRAPTRPHPSLARRPGSRTLRAVARWGDRVEDWSETHWGWADTTRAVRSPRAELVDVLRRQVDTSPPSIRTILSAYDRAVEEVVHELAEARTAAERAGAARRMSAAIGIHDAVLGGVLCPLLRGLPKGDDAADELETGCRERTALRRRLEALVDARGAETLFREYPEEVGPVLDELAGAFTRHEREATMEVASVLDAAPPEAFRTATSPLDDVMWPWHSEGPAALALQMALWAQAAPTRAHEAMVEQPRSRVLRSWYHLTDYLSDRWHDTWLERFLFPDLPPRPFSEIARSRRGERRAR